MVYAVIFDLDGLLTDTERLHCMAYRNVLESHGIHIEDADYYDHWTRQGKEIGSFVAERGLDIDAEVIREEKRELYRGMLRENVPVIDGAGEALGGLCGRFPLALASASYKPDVDIILDKTGWGEYFSAVVTGSHVTKRKPDPECFVLASALLGRAPSLCAAIDDSERGINPALKIGMKTVWVPNRHTAEDKPEAYTVRIESLRELTPELVESLFMPEA